MTRITIYNADGTVFKEPLITEGAKKTSVLMDMCYIALSWNDTQNKTIPAGSYIDYDGERYWSKDPYKPSQVNESSYTYTPKFYDKTSMWSTQPFFLVTETGVETDFQFTGYPGQFLDILMRAIEKYAGESLTYTVDSSIAQAKMETLTFQNVNIFQAANNIASKFGTEWWRSGNVFHLSRCETGSNVTLEVGKNIKIPSITKSKEGYYTRYYAFGSTRNIPQDYDDMGFTNGIVNKRLTLNHSKYPGGYIDVRSGLLPNEIFPVTLIFDDIYPALFYNISDVAGDPNNYVLDDNGNKIQIGEDAEGNPIYQMFTVWKFKIPDFDFNDTTYDKDDNPNGMLLPGKEFSVIFQSGQLNGREFSVIYDKKEKTYELKYIKDGGIIVPGATSLIPADGDKIALNNIRVESGDITTAQDELEDALREEMGKAVEDSDSRTFSSNPIAFKRDGTVLGIGTPVTYVNGTETLSTRVLKVESQIDIPEQKTITIGESIIRGNTEEIKEEVINANQNIDEAKALADLAKSITDGYYRVQQTIMNSLQNYRGLWTLNQNDAPDDPTKWTINTDYTVFSAGDVVAYATYPFDKPADMYPVGDYTTYGLFRAKKDGGLLFDESTGWYVNPDFQGGGGGIDEEQLKAYLTTNKYVTSKYLDDNGYVKLSSPLTGYAKAEAYTPIEATDTLLTALGKLEKNFDNYVDLTSDQTVGGTKTFTENLLSQKDVIAYATGSPIDDLIPVASTTTYGIVKIDGSTIKMNASGQLYVDGDISGGGGIDFTVGTGLNLSTDSVLSVKYGTTSGTACRGDDSRLSDARRNPYYLSWSGYNTGSYDGSQSKSFTIPNNTNQLTNGAGFIVDGNGNFDTLTGSGDASKYLAGNGTFYKISYNELSGTPDLSVYVTLGTEQTITAQKTYTSLGWYNGVGILKAGPKNNVHIIFGAGSGNVINGVTSGESIGNLYFNYTSSSQYTRIDSSNNIITGGDVVAYSTGSSVSDYAPVGSTTTYGLLKYDGTTIGKNSSGQLYVINSGSGGGSSVDVSWGTQNEWTGSITIGGTTYAFIKSGAISAEAEYTSGVNIGKINIGGSSKTFYVPAKVGTSNVGASDKPIYLSYGTPTACSSTKGSASLPVYMNAGTITACTGSSIFSSMSISGSTLYVTVAGQQRYVTLPSSGGSTITSVDGLSGGTINGNVSVGGATYSGLSIRRSSSYYWNLHMRSDNTLYFAYNGTSSHKMSLTSGGALYITGALTQNSDIRLKTVVRDIENVLDSMSKIRVFEYYLNSDNSQKLQIGYSAQEVLRYWSANVGMNDGYYTLNYGGMAAIAFQGVKELYSRLKPVETEVEKLKNKVSNLQQRLDNAYRDIFLLKTAS